MLFKQRQLAPWLCLDILHKNIIHINEDKAHPASRDRTIWSFFGHNSKNVLSATFFFFCKALPFPLYHAGLSFELHNQELTCTYCVKAGGSSYIK